MIQALLSQFGRVPLPLASGRTPKALVSAFNTEIAGFGYTFDATMLKALGRLSRPAFLSFRQDFLDHAAEISGANHNHRMLYAKFPYETPDHQEYLNRRIVGLLQNFFHHNIEDADILACGHLIDRALFPRDAFNACPICQFADDDSAPQAKILTEFKRLSPLKPVLLATPEFLQKAASAMLARTGSLSLAERTLLKELGATYRPEIPARIARENIPLLYHFHGADAVRGHLAGATDLLRIAAFVSNNDADLSLAEPVRYKVATRHKKAILRLLDGLKSPLEDMLRHREKWLRLGEKLNPGSADNRRRFPQAAAAFDTLRNNAGTVSTFNRHLEAALRGGKIDKVFLDALASRPGEFLRRLEAFLRRADDPARILSHLRKAAPKATLKSLFEVTKYFRYRAQMTISGDKPARNFILKGARNRLKMVEDRRADIDVSTLQKVVSILEDAIKSKLEAAPPLGKVYIDPALAKMVMPYNRRGDSQTAMAISKGSRYPLHDGDVVRLFVHWKGNVDVDLSYIAYDAKFASRGYISWSQTRGEGALHSGDIQNAPHGASEFIDFDIDNMAIRGVRYVVASVISYRGETFDSFPCFAGFMMRDALKSGAPYEPESVQLKFDLSMPATSHMPLVIDIQEREVIFVDLSAEGGRYRAVAHQSAKFSALLRGTITLLDRKPTAFDVVFAHAQARGTVVNDEAEADIVFKRENLDMEQILEFIQEPEK